MYFILQSIVSLCVAESSLIEFNNVLIASYSLKFVDNFTPFDCEHMRDTWDLEHLCDLLELFDINIVENNLAIMLIDFFLHEWLEDLAGTAPGCRALKDDGDFAINDLIPLLNVGHSSSMRLLCFASRLSCAGLIICTKRYGFNSLLWSRSCNHSSTLARHRSLVPSTLLLHNESPHASSNKHLRLCLTNKVLEEALLYVHN